MNPRETEPGRPVLNAPRAILFDLDGVLVDSFEIWAHVLALTAEELGVPPITREHVRASWGQSVDADIDQYFPGRTREEIARSYDRYFRAHLDRIVVLPGANALLDQLSDAGRPTAVVTNSPRDVAGEILEHASFRVECLVAGTDVPAPKPAPDMVTLACEKLGVTPNEAWMIGDTEYDRRAASGAGVFFVGVGIDGDLRVDGLSALAEIVRG